MSSSSVWYFFHGFGSSSARHFFYGFGVDTKVNPNAALALLPAAQDPQEKVNQREQLVHVESPSQHKRIIIVP
jgi:hypothetical protein